MRIIVYRDDGIEQDITELVQVAYDVATHSMDWGSGFLDIEETNGLIRLAEVCQFPDLDEILQEQWRARFSEGKTYEELQALAHERGVTWTHQIAPTDQEKADFLLSIRGETP